MAAIGMAASLVQLSLNQYTQCEHIWFLRKPAAMGRRISKALNGLPEPTRSVAKGPGASPGNSTYPHNEQIEYSMRPLASPEASIVNSSTLSARICNAALQCKFSGALRLGF
jgi:hypothetical protein